MSFYLHSCLKEGCDLRENIKTLWFNMNMNIEYISITTKAVLETQDLCVQCNEPARPPPGLTWKQWKLLKLRSRVREREVIHPSQARLVEMLTLWNHLPLTFKTTDTWHSLSAAYVHILNLTEYTQNELNSNNEDCHYNPLLSFNYYLYNNLSST